MMGKMEKRNRVNDGEVFSKKKKKAARTNHFAQAFCFLAVAMAAFALFSTALRLSGIRCQ
jgi:cytochrome b subunit of formate dehydrogenase